MAFSVLAEKDICRVDAGSLEVNTQQAGPCMATWQGYHRSSEQRVWPEEKPLVLSPSAIQTYLTCPRQYFYQYVLQLPGKPPSSQARFGLWTHRILELFNGHFQQEYTLTSLQGLIEQVFQWQNNKESLEALGMRPRDFYALGDMTELERQYLQQEILLSCADLADNGYFAQPFQKLYVEEWLEAKEPCGIAGLTLKGRLDLMRENADGSLDIVDYKTTRSQYRAVREETNLRPLLSTLTEPEDYHQCQGKQFQLPLYWLMAKEHPDFTGRPIHICIQLVRPATQGGAIAFRVTDDQLEAGKAHLIRFLQDIIVTPLQTMHHYVPIGDPRMECSYCAYTSLCEGRENAEKVGLM